MIVGLNFSLLIFLLALLSERIYDLGLGYRLLLLLLSDFDTLLVLDLLLFCVRILSNLCFYFIDSDRLYERNLFISDFSLFCRGPIIAFLKAADMPSLPISSLVLDRLFDF